MHCHSNAGNWICSPARIRRWSRRSAAPRASARTATRICSAAMSKSPRSPAPLRAPPHRRSRPSPCSRSACGRWRSRSPNRRPSLRRWANDSEGAEPFRHYLLTDLRVKSWRLEKSTTIVLKIMTQYRHVSYIKHWIYLTCSARREVKSPHIKIAGSYR
jgi:hypothetical protein